MLQMSNRKYSGLTKGTLHDLDVNLTKERDFICAVEIVQFVRNGVQTNTVFRIEGVIGFTGRPDGVFMSQQSSITQREVARR